MGTRSDYIVLVDIMEGLKGICTDTQGNTVRSAMTLLIKPASAGIDQCEAALTDIRVIPGTEVAQSLLHSLLASKYGESGDYSKVMLHCKEALPGLQQDPRLVLRLADCMHNLAAAHYQAGDIDKAINILEQVLIGYEKMNEADRVKTCRENLSAMRSSAKRPTQKASVWSRLFGKR